MSNPLSFPCTSNEKSNLSIVAWHLGTERSEEAVNKKVAELQKRAMTDESFVKNSPDEIDRFCRAFFEASSLKELKPLKIKLKREESHSFFEHYGSLVKSLKSRIILYPLGLSSKRDILKNAVLLKLYYETNEGLKKASACFASDTDISSACKCLGLQEMLNQA